MNLATAGYQVDIVGSRSHPPYDGGDPDHDGYPGALVGPDNFGLDASTLFDRVTGRNGFTSLVGPHVAADVIVLALGWNSAMARDTDAGNQYRQLVEAVQARKPDAEIVLATLSPRQGYSEAWTEDGHPGYRILNAMARNLANASGSDRLHLADLAAGGFQSADYTDFIHWSASGARRAAAIIQSVIENQGLIDFARGQVTAP